MYASKVVQTYECKTLRLLSGAHFCSGVVSHVLSAIVLALLCIDLPGLAVKKLQAEITR